MAPKPKDKGKRASSSSMATLPPHDTTRFSTREAENRFDSRFANRFVVCERPIRIGDFLDLPLDSWL